MSAEASFEAEADSLVEVDSALACGAAGLPAAGLAFFLTTIPLRLPFFAGSFLGAGGFEWAGGFAVAGVLPGKAGGGLAAILAATALRDV